VALEARVRGRLAQVCPACGIGRWPQLSSGLLRMEESECLSEAVRRVEALEPAQRRALAERGLQAARRLSLETIQQWLEILVHSVREKKFV
jgi:hypothetical protein